MRVQTPEAAAHITKLHETVIKKNHMYPFWVFADLMVYTPEHPKYWCFIGAHYPEGMVNLNQDDYETALRDLEIGHWKTVAMQKAQAGSNIGYGCAATPSDAFIAACRMAGCLKA